MYQNILLPVDLSKDPTQRKALEVAVNMASDTGAQLTVMTVVPDFGMTIVSGFFPEGFEEKAMKEAQARLHDYVKESVPDDIKVRHMVGHGTIYTEILRVAGEANIDLIVIASHRPELSDYLLGPNAARVVRHADCSVLVVRGG